MTRPNNVTTNYGYDNQSRLLTVLHQLSGSTIDGAVYTVDSAGNRTAKTDKYANVTSNYGYDAIYELLQTTQGATTTESYTYDPVGNRLSSLGVSPYSNNSSNELTSTPSASYTYDNNGNTLTKTASGSTTNYIWDYENRLMSVVISGAGGTATFKYDPFGRRIQKVFTQGSTTTTSNYLYDADNSAQDLDQNGNLLARYAETENIDEPLAESRSGTTSYYQQDGLGSVTSLSNSSGSLANTYTYDSFGKLTASTGSITNRFQYTARELDAETGLYFYRARYYDPSVARFAGEDPLRWAGGVNLYLYVRNQAVTSNDPEGLTGPTGNPDLNCLICTVYGEGGGQSAPCQYGIASVILNRLGKQRRMHPNEPSSICSIVHQPGQFDAVTGKNPSNYNQCMTCSVPAKRQADLNRVTSNFTVPFDTDDSVFSFGNNLPWVKRYFGRKGLKPVDVPSCPKLIFFGGKESQ